MSQREVSAPEFSALTPTDTEADLTKPRQPDTKQAHLIALLRRKRGASIAELVKAVGWQPHSVRGAISGTVKKKLGLTVITEDAGKRGRVYRIVAEQ